MPNHLIEKLQSFARGETVPEIRFGSILWAVVPLRDLNCLMTRTDREGTGVVMFVSREQALGYCSMLDPQASGIYTAIPCSVNRNPAAEAGIFRVMTYEEMAGRHLKEYHPVACSKCQWRGNYGELLRLGSVGRGHCPLCRADYGYYDGVMPMVPLGVELPPA